MSTNMVGFRDTSQRRNLNPGMARLATEHIDILHMAGGMTKFINILHMAVGLTKFIDILHMAGGLTNVKWPRV